MDIVLFIEIFATLTGLTYVILLMREQIICWFFGIVSSILSIWLFYHSKLFAESMLYFYYVLMGIYGWYNWGNHRKEMDEALPISSKNYTFLLFSCLIAVACSLSLSYLLNKYTTAERAMIDSFTTVFSFLATYLQTQKYISNWLFWIVINAVSVWLYYDRGLNIYAGLMLVYLILSIIGFTNWRQKLQTQIN